MTELLESYEKKYPLTTAKLPSYLSERSKLELYKFSDEINSYALEYSKKTKKVRKICGYLITINPKNHIEFNIFKEIIAKVLKKKWMCNVMYSFEQRSKTYGEYHGFHCHLVVRIDTNQKIKYKSDVIRELFSTCKKICTKNAINVRYLRTEPDIKRAIDYIRGNKDVSKLDTVSNDLSFRQKYSLDEFYVCGTGF